MKRTPEYIEGPEALTRFENAMKKVPTTISHAEIQRRIEAERAASALNPHAAGSKADAEIRRFPRP